MSVEIILLCLFIFFLVTLILGLPVAFVLITTGLLGVLVFLSPNKLFIGVSSIFGVGTNQTLLCLPLFVFMSCLLRYSGIAEGLFDALHKWSGGLKGSLAIATVFACTIIAAMTGIGATGVVTMSMIAYPEMKKRGYHDEISLGSIVSGGSLGPLIPPSGNMIIVGMLSSVSIGKLFAGGIIPGIIAAGLFALYIAVRSALKPDLAPALPSDMRPTWKQKFVVLRYVIAPVLLIVAVLGSIYTGAATPTEAAGVGAFGAGICALINRQLNWANLKLATYETLRITIMCAWLVIGGNTFVALLTMTGISEFVGGTIAGFAVPPFAILGGIMLIVFFLGMFIDPISISVIGIPLFVPIVEILGFDITWFCIVFVLFTTTGYLTPPFGMNLFYLKGCLPQTDVTMASIYRSSLPFAGILVIVAIIGLVLPELIMWLPNKTF